MTSCLGHQPRIWLFLPPFFFSFPSSFYFPKPVVIQIQVRPTCAADATVPSPLSSPPPFSPPPLLLPLPFLLKEQWPESVTEGRHLERPSPLFFLFPPPPCERKRAAPPWGCRRENKDPTRLFSLFFSFFFSLTSLPSLLSGGRNKAELTGGKVSPRKIPLPPLPPLSFSLFFLFFLLLLFFLE